MAAPSRFVPALAPGRRRCPVRAAEPRSRSADSSGLAASRLARTSAASSSRPGSSRRVAPSPAGSLAGSRSHRRRCRCAGIGGDDVVTGARLSGEGGDRGGGLLPPEPGSPRGGSAPDPGNAGRRSCGGSLDRRLPTRPGPIAVGNGREVGDPGELGVGGAGQLLLDGDQAAPLAWRRLTATSWSRWRGPYRAVLPR